MGLPLANDGSQSASQHRVQCHALVTLQVVLASALITSEPKV